MSKDKIILVITLGSGIPFEDYETIIKDANDKINRQYPEDDLPVTLFVPGRDYETKIECINPVVLNEEQYKEYDEIIKKCKESIDNG